MTLLISQRREQLVLWLAQHQYASVPQLASHFQVSEMTIRRDLMALQDMGLVERTRGGVEIAHSAQEPSFSMKRLLYAIEKAAIAREALQFVESGMTVALSAGTTTWHIARILKGFSRLTFVTNSTNVADALQQNGWDAIILTGGNYRTPSDALVGPVAERTIRGLYSDLLFLGVHALDLQGGISTPNPAEAAVDQVLMEQARRVVLVVDHSKFGTRTFCRIASLAEADAIVTDEGADHDILEQLIKLGLDVRVARVEPMSEESNGFDQGGECPNEDIVSPLCPSRAERR